MHVVVSSEMLVREADQVATEVEEKIKQMFDKVLDFKIRIESDEAHDKHAKKLTVEENLIVRILVLSLAAILILIAIAIQILKKRSK